MAGACLVAGAVRHALHVAPFDGLAPPPHTHHSTARGARGGGGLLVLPAQLIPLSNDTGADNPTRDRCVQCAIPLCIRRWSPLFADVRILSSAG